MRKIFFEIPFNIFNKNKKYTSQKYCLPAKDWIEHNKIDINDSNLILFSFIRCPFERVIIQYNYQMKNRNALKQYPMTFSEWCLASFSKKNKFMQNNPKEFLPQTEWIKGIEHKLNLSSCKESFVVEKYYDEKTMKIVKNFYESDFKKFSNVYF